MNDDELERLRARWTDQTVEAPVFSPEALAAASEALKRNVRNRNRREYAAVVVVVGVFTAYAWFLADPWMRAGSVWTVFAALWVGAVLRARGTPLERDAAADGKAWLIAELERERDLLASVWRWYLGPFIPGLILFFVGPALRVETVVVGVALAGMVAGVVAVLAYVGRLNQRAAAEIERTLREARDA